MTKINIRYKGFLLMLIWLVSGCINIAYCASNSTKDVFMTAELDMKDVFAGQPAVASIYLYSNNPSVSFLNPITEPSLVKGDFQFLRKVDIRNRAIRVKIGNEDYFKYPIESFVFSVAENGKNGFIAPQYEIGIDEDVVIRDPFWGNVRTSKTNKYIIKPDEVKFKINNLPSPQSSSHFSGSMGDFKISTFLPPGDIFIGEEATAYVTVSGNGILAESVMPEYRSAFSDGLKLKSVSENRNEKFVNSKLVSELTLEITFIPENHDNLQIGPISFDYFDPSDRKYKIIKSDSVDVKVKSSTSRRSHIEI